MFEKIFKNRSDKRNFFKEAKTVNPDRSCFKCVHRQADHPFVCSDGWASGDPTWTDRGEKCQNWIQAPVVEEPQSDSQSSETLD